MKMKSIRSAFFAVVAVILTALTAVPFAALAQEDNSEVILTLEGTYKGQVKFVFIGDTIRYEPRTFAPIYPAPTGVTVDGMPWTDLGQPFKLGLTPDFENVTTKGKVDGSKVFLGRGRDRVELTLNDAGESVRIQLRNLGESDLLADYATHFAVPLVIKNNSSSSRPVFSFTFASMGPSQSELMKALDRRTDLEITLKILEEAPVTPENSRSRKESIDSVRRQIDDLDRRIESLKELVHEAARNAPGANEVKTATPRQNSGPTQPAAQTTEELLKQGLELREMVEAQIKSLEQDQDADADWKARQIEVQRQSLDDLDRKIAVLKDRLAKEKEAAGDTADASAPGRETDNAKEMSLPVRQAIAGDLNRQGFRLLQTLSEEKENENKFISPYSIDSAFGMVYTGAKGRTQGEIRTVLGMPEGPDTADAFFHDMADQYHAAENVDVLVSNSVWVDHRVTDLIRPDYRRTIENYYDGAFYVEDFTKKATVADKVNALVDQNTKGMIKNVITPDDLTERTRMILLNTLFFEAKWLHPFKEEQTWPMPFYRFGGGSKQVRMMYQKRRFDYYYCEEDNVHAVVLPYENPRFDLVALMPVDPGADQGQAAMKSILAKIGDKLGSWLSNPSPYETRVWLPKVDLTDSMRLKDTLKDLGMPSAFSPFTADFSGMFDYSKNPGDERFYIEKVIHKTALKMDEYSTKAAAATAIIAGFGGGFMQPPPENVFRADRPYLVLIRDNWTGLILFMGRINDPGVEASAEDGPAIPSFGLPPNGPGSTTPGTNSLPGFRPAAQTNPRQTTTARPASATTRTGEPATAKADGGQNKRDVFAGVPLWDKERDGQPEIRLRELVDEAAKRAEADLRSLGAVRITSVDAEHSYADIDFTVVDEYGRIVHFIDEVEKQTPRLSWRRVEIRVEPAGRTLSGDKPKADSPPADAVRKYRLTGQIRVITYTPAKKETTRTAGDSAAAKEKAKSERVDVDPGDPDFLAKLYDLSLALPEDALVTQLRFNSGNCDLTIQAQDRMVDLPRRLVFPYWRIARLSQRIISNDICSFAVSLVRNDDPSEPQKDSATSAVMIEHIVALNIFDPDRTPKKEAVKHAADSREADLERQLEDAMNTRAELTSLLETLRQTQGGLTEEQTELIRQRIEASNQRIERLQNQLKALRP